MAVRAKISISGVINVQYPDNTTLTAAGSLFPDTLANNISLSIGLITGVQSSSIKCGIIDIEGDSGNGR